MSAKSKMHNKEQLKNFLLDVLIQSGEIARKYFKKNCKVEYKADASPVTLADKEIELFIRKQISKNHPEYGVVGEEFEEINKSASIKFVIDPIDGTKAFINGKPTFGIMIGIICDSKPILSAIHQPITGEIWAGDCFESLKFTNKAKAQQKIQSNNIVTLKEAIIATTSYEFLTNKGVVLFDKLSPVTKEKIIGGDCYNYCKLAEGKIDLIIEENLKFHDYIPLLPILKSTNATITDFSGNAITNYTQKITSEFMVCANKNILEEILSLNL